MMQTPFLLLLRNQFGRKCLVLRKQFGRNIKECLVLWKNSADVRFFKILLIPLLRY